MAFCTQCGAEVAGAFCSKCGAPTGQPSAAQPAAAAAPAAAPGEPVPEKRRTNPLVWVLIIILGIVGIGIVGVVGTGAFVAHRLRQAGVDSDLWARNPGLAVGKVMAAVNPHLEVLDTDEDAGRVTLRDRRNGKRFSIGIDAARHGQFSLRAEEDGKTANLQIGGDAQIPLWVPQYPGSRPEPTFSAQGESDRDAGEAGNFTFKTTDSASKVIDFYRQKGRDMGLSIRTGDAAGALTVAIGEDEHDRVLKVVAFGGSDETTVNVTYARKK